jgi:hypothetical protein
LDNLPKIIDTVFELVKGAAEGIIKSIPVILDALPDIITSIIDLVITWHPKMWQLGFDLLTALVKNLPDIIAHLFIALGTIISKIVNYFSEHRGDMIQAGRDLIINIWEGIKSMGQWFRDNFYGWIGGIFNGLADNGVLHNLPGRAGGGRAYANMPYLVGDDAQRRPEIFVPDTNGTILNGDQTERVLNNINNSRTVGDVNIYLNSYGADATSIANEIGIAVQQKLRMSGAMLY